MEVPIPTVNAETIVLFARTKAYRPHRRELGIDLSRATEAELMEGIELLLCRVRELRLSTRADPIEWR